MDDIGPPGETGYKCEKLGIEVAQLVPRHSPTPNKPSEQRPRGPEPGQIHIAVRRTVQHSSKALRVEVADELGITRVCAPVPVTRVFEADPSQRPTSSQWDIPS